MWLLYSVLKNLRIQSVIFFGSVFLNCSSSRSMEKKYEKKIPWTIKNFSSLQSKKVYSDHFVVGDSKWRLVAYPKGHGDDKNKSLSLFLNVADSESLPHDWKRHIKFRLIVVNQNSEELSQQIVEQAWFSQKHPSLGYSSVLPISELCDRNCGFLVNGEVKIVVEVGVLEIIGLSDVLVETSLVNESIHVNGFQVLHSQVESVNSLFEKHPDIASQFRPKNPHRRTAYLNSILSLTESLYQSPEDISNADLANAYYTLTCVTKAGFKLDWLEKKLKEIGEARLQEIEEELKDMKQKCVDMEALLEFLR